MDVEERLARLARRQHGCVARHQALALGCSDEWIRYRVRVGRWEAPHRGVYVVAGAPRTYEQTVLAACLAAGDGCAASHRTAAALWRLRVPEADAVDVLTHSGRRVRLPGVRHHRTDRLHLADLTWRRGVPVTTVARTLVDCADVLRGQSLGRAIDDAVRRELLRVDDLEACLARFEGARGRPVRRLRVAVAARTERLAGGSDGELWVLGVLRAAGLPAPVQEHEVVVDGRRRRLDLAYPAARVGIEFDGFDVHGRLRTVFDDDRSRQNALQTRGWLLLRFTSASTPEEVVRRTRQALDLAARRSA